MSKKDEKKLESLTIKAIKLKGIIYKIQREVNKVENEADKLLRRLLNRNGNKR